MQQKATSQAQQQQPQQQKQISATDYSQTATTDEETQQQHQQPQPKRTSLPKAWLKGSGAESRNNNGQPSATASANTVPNLKPIRVIGNGAFGFVFEAYDLNRDVKVAVKRTQKAGNVVSREYEVMALLKGAPNVTQLLEFFYSLDHKQRLIQNIVMEYCEGSLEDQLKQAEKSKQPIPMAHVRHFTKQLFNGLAQMHAQNISHRDLKPENILIKQPSRLVHPNDPLKSELKIADLGAAKVLSENGLNTPYVVSRYYRAPELIMGSNKYDCSIDVWSTGCILFELITRTPLFPGDAEGLQILEQCQVKGMPTPREMAELQKICEAPVMQLLQRNQDFGATDLVDIMLSNSRSRYAREDIEQAVDLIEQCLKWVPKERIRAKDALDHPFLRQSTASQA